MNECMVLNMLTHNNLSCYLL